MGFNFSRATRGGAVERKEGAYRILHWKSSSIVLEDLRVEIEVRKSRRIVDGCEMCRLRLTSLRRFCAALLRGLLPRFATGSIGLESRLALLKWLRETLGQGLFRFVQAKTRPAGPVQGDGLTAATITADD